MKSKPIAIVNKTIAQCIITGVMLGSSATTWADNTTETQPLALRTIMQELSKNMQAVTDAISREDWARVARIAPLIADHPKPPQEEKVRILSFIGPDAGRFKAFDGKTHQTAKVLGELASKQDGGAVISTFAALQSSCLACHESFRSSFKRHFYGLQ